MSSERNKKHKKPTKNNKSGWNSVFCFTTTVLSYQYTYIKAIYSFSVGK